MLTTSLEKAFADTSFSVSDVERAACSFRNGNRVQEQAGSMFYSASLSRN